MKSTPTAYICYNKVSIIKENSIIIKKFKDLLFDDDKK